MVSQSTDRSVEIPSTTSEGSERNSREYGSGVQVAAMSWDHFRSETTHLMDAVVERENMIEALHRVERNKGSAGIDKMRVEALSWMVGSAGNCGTSSGFNGRGPGLGLRS